MRLLLRTRDTAHALGISESQVCKYRRAGLLTPVVMPGIRAIRFDASEVEGLARRIIAQSRGNQPETVTA